MGKENLFYFTGAIWTRFAIFIIILVPQVLLDPILALTQTNNSGCDGIRVFYVAESTDDAGPNPVFGCSFRTDWNEIYFAVCPDGTPAVSGFRFSNINIPQGTQISKAYLEFTVDGPHDADLSLTIYGENTGNAQPFDQNSQPKDRDRINDPAVEWHIPATQPWEWNQTWTSPDLKDIVQTILERSDWQEGHAMAFIIEGQENVTERHRRVMGYDRPNSTYSGDVARLVIIIEPVIPLPKITGNKSEVKNLWEDIQVQESHAELCPMFPPGGGINIAIMDKDLGPREHGVYTSHIAAGPVDGAAPGSGYNPGDLPGIAAGATLFTSSPRVFMSDFSYEDDFICIFLGNCQRYAEPIMAAYEAAINDAGQGGVIGVPMVAGGVVTKLLNFDLLNISKALEFLELVENYTQNDSGIVVLPSNFFARHVAENQAVKTKLGGSGALVAHAILRGEVPVDTCSLDNYHCATSREEINIVVPTTNHNISVAVPAVAAVALLMKKANPNLSSQQIRDILTNKIFGQFQKVKIRINDNQYKEVAVLNALKAVNAAKYFPD